MVAAARMQVEDPVTADGGPLFKEEAVACVQAPACADRPNAYVHAMPELGEGVQRAGRTTLRGRVARCELVKAELLCVHALERADRQQDQKQRVRSNPSAKASWNHPPRRSCAGAPRLQRATQLVA